MKSLNFQKTDFNLNVGIFHVVKKTIYFIHYVIRNVFNISEWINVMDQLISIPIEPFENHSILQNFIGFNSFSIITQI